MYCLEINASVEIAEHLTIIDKHWINETTSEKEQRSWKCQGF